MTKLTDIEGADFTADDEAVEAAVEDAAAELGMDPEEVSEEVAYILDSGSGRVNNEGVAGTAAAVNEDTADDPRLEALEVFKLRQEL
jgi:CO/xanthine dehydrogenase Mo-binding subunit